MPNKDFRVFAFLIIIFSLCHFCLAQDTLSRMTFYGNKNSYQKVLDKEFVKINIQYRTGIKHGLYYVYDLVDTSNKLTSEYDTVLFVDKHIYHVVSPSVYGKVSMIIIPYNGNMFAFIGLNCCKKKHDVEDVIIWVENNLQNVDHSTLERIRNYYVFHPNIRMDPQESMPICEFRCRHHPSHKHDHYKKPKILYRSKNHLQYNCPEIRAKT